MKVEIEVDCGDFIMIFADKTKWLVEKLKWFCNAENTNDVCSVCMK